MDPQARDENRCSLAAEVLQTRGTLQLRAMGASMLPTLWPGDLVIIQARKFEQVEAGEIALCLREGRFYLHRIVKKSSLGDGPFLVLRGDAMAKPDPLLGMEGLLGIVTGIQRRGSNIASSRLAVFRRLLGRLLCHSDLCHRAALRWHARRGELRSSMESTMKIMAS